MPDAPGLASWGALIDKEQLSRAAIAKGMIESLEGQQLYPAGQSSSDFVKRVLNRVLGRPQ